MHDVLGDEEILRSLRERAGLATQPELDHGRRATARR
jgi:hypothetical protein